MRQRRRDALHQHPRLRPLSSLAELRALLDELKG
jgi:hypothetical protein